MARGEYGTATLEELEVLDDVAVSTGLLDVGETKRFETTVIRGQEIEAEESSNPWWKWVVGIVLLAVGL